MSSPFHQLHLQPTPLLLPNAWDAGSARVIESCGAQAIATTSAGLAWACGYPDGNALPSTELLAAVRRIARIVRVPISIDIEEGLAESNREIAALVTELAALGVSGINIEDGEKAPEKLAEKITAIRTQLHSNGHAMFINARTDVFLRGIALGEAALTETLRRADLYIGAGCDGVFVPALSDLAQIKQISAGLGRIPLNVMWLPNFASIAELQAAGVRRISAGAALSKHIVWQTQALTSQYLRGEWDGIAGPHLDYSTINDWFRR